MSIKNFNTLRYFNVHLLFYVVSNLFSYYNSKMFCIIFLFKFFIIYTEIHCFYYFFGLIIRKLDLETFNDSFLANSHSNHACRKYHDVIFYITLVKKY